MDQGLQLLQSLENDVKSALFTDIVSGTSGGRLMHRAILESIASNMTNNLQDLESYVESTLAFVESKNDKFDIRSMIAQSLDYLTKNEFLEFKGENYQPTQLGSAALSSTLPPHEALAVLADLREAQKNLALDTDLHMLYLVHLRFFACLMLFDLINEMSLEACSSKYQVNRGYLQTLQQQGANYAGMIVNFCDRLGWYYLKCLLSGFAERIAFGVRRELTELVALPGLDGARARIFHQNSLDTLASIAGCDPRRLGQVLRKAVPFQSGQDCGRETKRPWLANYPDLTEDQAIEHLKSKAARLLAQKMQQFVPVTNNENFGEKLPKNGYSANSPPKLDLWSTNHQASTNEEPSTNYAVDSLSMTNHGASKNQGPSPNHVEDSLLMKNQGLSTNYTGPSTKHKVDSLSLMNHGASTNQGPSPNQAGDSLSLMNQGPSSKHAANSLSMMNHGALKNQGPSTNHAVDSLSMMNHGALTNQGPLPNHTGDSLLLMNQGPSTKHEVDLLSLMNHGASTNQGPSPNQAGDSLSLMNQGPSSKHAANSLSMMNHGALKNQGPSTNHAVDSLSMMNHGALTNQGPSPNHAGDSLLMMNQGPSTNSLLMTNQETSTNQGPSPNHAMDSSSTTCHEGTKIVVLNDSALIEFENTSFTTPTAEKNRLGGKFENLKLSIDLNDFLNKSQLSDLAKDFTQNFAQMVDDHDDSEVTNITASMKTVSLMDFDE
uniref:DNA polymerase theta-like helix-turn-helix domain-containing protein n=1 Tax=Romanomermis culicivorax TaxID=13658 RepID=A0A915IWL8_ROMCU